jgi:hypothetical protein
MRRFILEKMRLEGMLRQLTWPDSLEDSVIQDMKENGIVVVEDDKPE